MHVPAQAYGKTTYLITTLRTVPRGTEGAVSLEGTAAGAAAAVLFAGGSCALGQVEKCSRALPKYMQSAGCVISSHAWLFHCFFFHLEVKPCNIQSQPEHVQSCPEKQPCNVGYVLQVSLQGAGVVAGAAVIANLFESYLGAALQGKALWLSNDIVNGIQICLAACVALVTTMYLYPQ